MSENQVTENTKKSAFIENLYEWVESVIYAFIAILILFSFCFRLVGVNGDSMNNTLQNGDWLVMSNFFYEPDYKDIVVETQSNAKDEPLIKRIIALENDVVDIDFQTSTVYVNGQALDEPYIAEQTRLTGDVDFPVTVPEGTVFVMGDNRNHSWDSRFTEIGFIDEDYLMGKAVLRLWPFGNWEVN